MSTFLATHRGLMALREHVPARYRFEDGMCKVEFPVEDDVARLFDDAARMFEPR